MRLLAEFFSAGNKTNLAKKTKKTRVSTAAIGFAVRQIFLMQEVPCPSERCAHPHLTFEAPFHTYNFYSYMPSLPASNKTRSTKRLIVS